MTNMTLLCTFTNQNGGVYSKTVIEHSRMQYLICAWKIQDTNKHRNKV